MQASEVEMKKLAANIRALSRKEAVRPVIFKGRVTKLGEAPEEIFVKIFKETEVKALVLQLGTASNHLNFQLKAGDLVILFKTDNAGYLALPIILYEEEPQGFLLKSENIEFSRSEDEKILLKIGETSMFETLLKDFGKVKEGLEAVNDVLKAVVECFGQLSEAVAPGTPAYKPTFPPKYLELTSAVPKVATAIAAIDELNNKIKEISL